jgi:hypothetical protein
VLFTPAAPAVAEARQCERELAGDSVRRGRAPFRREREGACGPPQQADVDEVAQAEAVIASAGPRVSILKRRSPDGRVGDESRRAARARREEGGAQAPRAPPSKTTRTPPCGIRTT